MSVARCARCERLHLPELRCWQGRYARRVCDQVFREQGRHCAQCRREGVTKRATTVDHIVARSVGGTDSMRNLEPLCVRHNSSKGARIGNPYPTAATSSGNGVPVSSRFRR